MRNGSILTQSIVLHEWAKILDVNYWSIFDIAGQLLRNINPPSSAVQMLKTMAETADKLIALGVSQSHDLAGTVFQKLIADRKFLATFYTRPESATLLAHLAIPDDGKWGDPERVKDFRIAEPWHRHAHHAAYRRMNPSTFWSDPEQLHAYMGMLNGVGRLPCDGIVVNPAQRYEGTRTVGKDYEVPSLGSGPAWIMES